MATAGGAAGRHVVLEVDVAASPGRTMAGLQQSQFRPVGAATLSRTRHRPTALVLMMAAAAPPRAFVYGIPFCGKQYRASSVKQMRVHIGTSCAVPSGTTAVLPTARVWFECDHCRSLRGSSSDFERHAVVCAATTPAGEDEEGERGGGGAPGGREPARDENGEGWEGRRDEGKGKRPARSR